MKRLLYILSILLTCSLSAMGQCPDWYDLEADYVKCEIGPYAARTGGAAWTTQRVDYGPDSRWSRHTTHRDGNEIDTVSTLNGTNPGLHTVPAGEIASVRLGNKMDGKDVACYLNDCSHTYTGQAERITYTFTVTEDSKYLLLRYAIIWENPNQHNDLLPSFQVETLTGASGETVINDLCFSFDMTVGSAELDYSGNSTFIHRVCNGYSGSKLDTQTHPVAWRDWRTRIINLEDYIGQTVRLRLTSSDCGHSGHFGYSYFTLRCLDANLYDPTCGGPTETRTFTAPTGLNYIWYKVNDSKVRTELLPESSNTLTVLNDGQSYECYIASPENANCHISLYAKAEPRLPLSDFDIDKHEACVDTVFLVDHSGVSHDGVTLISPHENVDVVTWDFGDGRTTSNYAAGTPITYDNDGTYTIMQVTKLNNGNCTDTLRKTVKVRGKLTKHESMTYDTICGGKIYTWNGSDYTSTGTYPYVMSNAAGGGFCDSIARLNLKVWDSYFRNDTIDVLEGKEIPYAWHSNGTVRNLYTSGLYWDSCHSVHGCDSVYRLVLQVRPKYYFLEYDTICDGESYSYHKNNTSISYTTAGTYYDSLLTKTYGNDSVYCLQLYVRDSYHFSETRNFCQGDTVGFHGSRFWTDGPHTVSFLSKYGCDSTYTLVLQQQQKFLIDTVVAISDKQKPFIWHGINCPTTGVYYDSLKTVNGCDSVWRLSLTIYPTFFQEDAPLTLCKDSTIHWHTKYLTGNTVGTFTVYDSLRNKYGYDSVYSAQLTVIPSYRVNLTVNKAIGEHYYFFGQDITTGGVYTYNAQTEAGCDSIVKLTINFLPTYYIRDTAYICEGGSYEYHKNNTTVYYTAERTYYDSLKTVAGYDSIYQLDLYVNPVYTTQQSARICQPNTYDFFGQTLTESGTYTKLLHSKSGCDSTIVLTLRVDSAYVIRVDTTICEGQSVVFAGESRTAGGFYTYTYTTKNGCDSVRQLNLTVIPKSRIHHDVHLCIGESFMWKGNPITSNTVLSDTVPSAVSGCDSINIWHVYTHNVLRDTTRAEICQNQTYTFHGHTYSVADTSELVGSSIYACDSTYVLILKINPIYETDTTFTLCTGGDITFNGKVYDEGGTYYDTLRTVGCNCDSTFIIHINEYRPFFKQEFYSLCKDSTYSWHGQTITGAGTYHDSLTTTLSGNQCDSVYELVVTLKMPSYEVIERTILSTSSFYFNEQLLNTSGTYFDTLPAVNNSCDSIVELHLTVLPVYTIDTTAYICRGEKYEFNGHQLETGGLYTERFISKVYGTDSVVNLTLIVYEPIIVETPVHISDKETYTWTKDDGTTEVLNLSGTYDDTIQSVVTGCDSINRLILTVHRTYLFSEDGTTCQGKPYYWRGNPYYTANDYYDSIKTEVWKVDSIYHLNLTVNPVYSHDTTVYICAGDYYNFNGKPISAPGTHYDTIQTVNSCDSTFRVKLVVRPTKTIPTVAAICEGETYSWRGKTYTISNEYVDTVRTLDNLCDSIYYKLSLTVKQKKYTTLPPAVICDNQWYDFCGRQINQPGPYDTTLTASNGCDSIVSVMLTVNPTYVKDTTFTLCTGGAVTFNSRVYTKGGTNRDTLRTVGCNCDSVYVIHINEYHPFFKQERAILCKDSTMQWHGQTITGAGTYHDSLTSTLSGNQCDSVYELVVTLQNPSYQILPVTILGNTSYSFGGQLLDSTGIYFDTIPAVNNTCDSIVELRLTVKPVYNVDTTVYICRGNTYDFNGQELDEGGLYTKTLISTQGTDSVINLQLVVYEPRIKTTPVHISDKETYTWTKDDGTTEVLNLSGTYDDTIQSVVTGCDSINRLILTVHRTYLFSEDGTTCQGKPYYWRGNPYYTANDYYDSIKTEVWKVDSIYHLNLTVNPVYSHDTTVYICAGDYYNFNGKPISAPGTHYDTIQTVNSCDSTFRVKLVVRPTKTIPTVAAICEGETYSWRGKTYTISNEYVDTVRTLDNLCDSIYYKLSLTVKQKKYTTLPPAVICDNQWYDFCGRQINQPGPYDTTLTASNGCDSIVSVMLTVNPTYVKDTTFTLCTGGAVTFNSRVYTKGGTNRDTLRTVGCNCDSVYVIHINEYHPFFKQERAILCKDSTMQWHGQTITGAGTYHDSLTSTLSGNQCDSVYELVVTTQMPAYTVLPITIWSTTYYSFAGKLLNIEDTYFDTLPAIGSGCDSIVELRLTVLPVYNIDTTAWICRGDRYLFNGRELEEPGLYTTKFVSSYGTDSIVNLTLVVYEPKIYEYPVHISDQETYTWTRHDGTTRVLSLTDTYDDSLYTSITHCDSVNRLKLYVHPTYHFRDTASICRGKSYTWRGNTYYTPSDYQDRYLTDTWHYDSIYSLHLTENPVYSHDTVVYICAGDYYDFNGTPITTPGVHLDTVPTTCCNCDSTFRVTIHIRPTRTELKTDYICPGDSYLWRGHTYTAGGEYEDTISTADGLCDSIYYHLSLRVKTRYEKEEYGTICDNEWYDFNGHALNKPGDYDTTLTSVLTMCDSVVHLHLTVNPTYKDVVYDTICEGQSILFGGMSYSTSGIYTYEGRTLNGCDSIVTLHLTVIAKQNAYYEKHICEGDYYEINGEQITQSGTYSEVAQTRFGCDSTTTWHVTIHRPMRDTLYKAICKGDEYNFHGVIYRDEGTYVHEDRSRYNCDSTYVLVLTHNPVYSRDTSIILCEHDYFTYNGHIYTEGGYYQDTARTKNGCNCDSILNITITKYPVVRVEQQANICRGETIKWRNQEISRPGFYYDTLRMTYSGCDSVIYCLNLIVNSDYYDYQEATICDNSYSAWRGHWLNETGIYYDSLTTIQSGCDSVYCLHLTVNPTYSFPQSVAQCDIESYWFNGQWLNRTGDYEHALKSTCGCDSIYSLHLIVNPTKRDTIHANLCVGETYDFNGRRLTQSGVYRDTINRPDITQCEITMLYVDFYQPTTVSKVDIAEICADDSVIQLIPIYSGTKPNAYTLIFDNNARAQGFENIMEVPFEDVINVPIPKKTEGHYVRPDYYTAQLKIDNELCGGAGTIIYDLSLLVKYPSWVIEQNWHDVVAVLNEYYNGGYYFSDFEWYLDDQPLAYENKSYIYIPQYMHAGDRIYAALTRSGEDYSVCTCPIVVVPYQDDPDNNHPVLVQPTYLPKQVAKRVTILSEENVNYQLYNAQGALLNMGVVDANQEHSVDIPAIQGAYLLHFNLPDGKHQLEKIIVE